MKDFSFQHILPYLPSCPRRFPSTTNLLKHSDIHASVWKPTSASSSLTLNSVSAQYCFQQWDCFSCRCAPRPACVLIVSHCQHGRRGGRWPGHRSHYNLVVGIGSGGGERSEGGGWMHKTREEQPRLSLT